jgi:hypothetical protein
MACLSTTLPSAAQSSLAWRAEYFDNPDLIGQPVLERNESAINYDWQDNSPDGSLPADRFSVRWTAYFLFEHGTYTFKTFTDGGVRLWVDTQGLIDQWGNPVPNLYEQQVALTAGYHIVRMEYRHNSGHAAAKLWWEQQLGQLGSNRWRAEYFDNPQLAGNPVLTREEAEISHNWGFAAPAPNLPTDGFSVRWTGNVSFDASGSYTFTATADDGVRVWIDGEALINCWACQPSSTISAVRQMTLGAHPIVIEYYNQSGAAAIQFSWQRETAAASATAPATAEPASLPDFDPNVVRRWGGPNESWYEWSHGYKGQICYDVGSPPCAE